MKILIATLITLAMLTTCDMTRAAAKDDEAAIHAVFTNFSRSWDQPGMPGFAALFTEDADFVVITGRWLKGRSDIVRYHRELLQSGYAGSRSLPVSTTVRFLTDNIAIVHVASGARYTRDGVEHIRTGLATATLVKRQGTWLITAFHNTLTSGPGAVTPLSSQ